MRSFTVSFIGALLVSFASAHGSTPPIERESSVVDVRKLEPHLPGGRLQNSTPAGRERQLFQDNELASPAPCEFVRSGHDTVDRAQPNCRRRTYQRQFE